MYAPDGSTLGRWALHGNGAPDITAVDRVARLTLAARSLGGTAVLSEVLPGLAEMFQLAGLGDLYGQMCREAKGREKPLGLEERIDRGDPAG
jgi:hypothetical protein